MVGELTGSDESDEDESVSVSLPRLGGWRVVASALTPRPMVGFSLVAEIGWLARFPGPSGIEGAGLFQSRCRDWVVGE